MNSEILIVGQGLAGTVLSSAFLKRGVKIKVADKGLGGSSSVVAAGIYNPVVFKRLTRSWMVEKCLPEAIKVYENLEKDLDSKFLFKKPILKILSSLEERKTWIQKSGFPEMQDYLSLPIIQLDQEVVKNDFGCGEVLNCGYLDVKKMLDGFRVFLRNKGCLWEENILSGNVALKDGWVECDGQKFEKVIFCEGSDLIENPFFNWLPMVPTKGDLLLLRNKSLPEDNILSKNAFLLPVGNNCFLAGSTYDWNNISKKPSKAASEDILMRIHQFIKTDFEILDHFSGIRPGVRDRRPLMGKHPEKHEIFVFNGFGAKGVLLMPFWAEQMADHVLEGRSLSSEVDISRLKIN